MTQAATLDAYGQLIEPTTLKIERLLPGPIERCWDYLTQSDLRRQWLASGEMDLTLGADVDLVWRNDEISDSPSVRPEGFDGKHAMTVQITELEAPRKLGISWGGTGGVTFELEPRGADVLLTVTHRRVADPAMLLSVSAGWHTHLDALAAVAGGKPRQPFWEAWAAHKAEYAKRLAL
jgi:uncharacterized protein YndB with AHSA1/START domain